MWGSVPITRPLETVPRLEINGKTRTHSEYVEYKAGGGKKEERVIWGWRKGLTKPFAAVKRKEGKRQTRMAFKDPTKSPKGPKGGRKKRA